MNKTGGTEKGRWLTTPEAAAYLRITPKTLTNWIMAGRAPARYKIGKCNYYLRADLDAFLIAGRIDAGCK